MQLFPDKCITRSGKDPFKPHFVGQWEKEFKGITQAQMGAAWKELEPKGWHPIYFKGYDSDKDGMFDVTWASGPVAGWAMIWQISNAADFGEDYANNLKEGRRVVAESIYRFEGQYKIGAVWLPK